MDFTFYHANFDTSSRFKKIRLIELPVDERVTCNMLSWTINETSASLSNATFSTLYSFASWILKRLTLIILSTQCLYSLMFIVVDSVRSVGI